MTDKQLLELAAKAMGMKVKGEIEWADGKTSWLLVKVDGRPKFRWNPLEDDGDALRLAVALSLWVAIDKTHCECIEIQGSGVWLLERLSEGQDPYVATRRAIVRAAAEIGKGM